VLIGLYLIAGIRFDIWNEGLLYCIPLLLFVFIIFYSVSALVGLLWGNAIVCVVSCIIFWLFCFAIGAIHDGMQQHVELLPQITRVDKIDGKLMVVNQRGDFSLWKK
jgi:ABC-type transport system involved in multi-copper enzyme maturation permease subunit